MYRWDREITSGKVMARKAGEIALQYWNRGVTAERKADASPVTVADKEAERAISRAIEEEFPEDGLLGEEGSAKPSRSGRRWIIDPIDGTRDFVRHYQRLSGALWLAGAPGARGASLWRNPQARHPLPADLARALSHEVL